MANTYSQIFLHVVFAVKHRQALMPLSMLPRIHAYMAEIANNNGHRVVEIGGTPNHVHILISYSVNQSIPCMIRDIKSGTSAMINANGMSSHRFEWQKGYACISVSASHVESVRHYIKNQMQHHYGVSFTEEIKRMLEKAGVRYDERYMMEDV